jgi:hypothetical protein
MRKTENRMVATSIILMFLLSYTIVLQQSKSVLAQGGLTRCATNRLCSVIIAGTIITTTILMPEIITTVNQPKVSNITSQSHQPSNDVHFIK